MTFPLPGGALKFVQLVNPQKGFPSCQLTLWDFHKAMETMAHYRWPMMIYRDLPFKNGDVRYKFVPPHSCKLVYKPYSYYNL